MKKLLVTLCILMSVASYSQFKITGYFDAEIGVSYQFSKKFQAEVKVNDNLGVDFSTKVSLLYQFITKEEYNLNFGAGISTFPFHANNIDFFESFYLPLQIEITPFKQVKRFGLVLESAYHFSETSNGSGIRNSIGIRYIFK